MIGWNPFALGHPSTLPAKESPFADGRFTQEELNEYYTYYESRYGYAGVTRRHLRNLAWKGDPGDVEAASGGWYSVSRRLYALADDLTARLLSLREGWTGEGSAEFIKRGFVVVAQLLTLADEAAAMQQGLSMMSSVLGVAIEQLKDGTPDDTLEKLFLDQAHGYVMLKPRPHDASAQWVKTVAELAMHYDLIEHRYWYGPRPERSPEPPPVPESQPPSDAEAVERAAHRSTARSPSALGVDLNAPAAPMQGAVALASPEHSRLGGDPGGGTGGGASSTVPAAMPGMMGMMGGALGGSSQDVARGRWSADELAWQKTDEDGWIDPKADRPPPAIS